MEYVGFDLGKVNSQICVLTEDGELVEKRIKTERETLAQFFGQRFGQVCIPNYRSLKPEMLKLHFANADY